MFERKCWPSQHATNRHPPIQFNFKSKIYPPPYTSAPGTFTSQMGAQACTPCDPGTFSPEGAPTCSSCESGTVAKTTGASACEACSGGSVPNEDATQCDLCDPGTSSPQGASTCNSCESGKVAETTGSASCGFCSKGSIPNDDGTQCLECEAMHGVGWTSLQGSSECDMATKGHYFDGKEGRIKPCPDGGLCDVEGTVIA